jgi:hypothetical protein
MKNMDSHVRSAENTGEWSAHNEAQRTSLLLSGRPIKARINSVTNAVFLPILEPHISQIQVALVTSYYWASLLGFHEDNNYVIIIIIIIIIISAVAAAVVVFVVTFSLHAHFRYPYPYKLD